jgi:polyhydroxyalkanoate synthesis repressor PhaR
MKKVIIKKYPNRRLYNTQISSYIALSDLYQMVKDGADFIVIDVKSDIDITHNILIQIIFEQEVKGNNLLSENILRQIITCYEDEQKHIMLSHYLAALMNSFSTNLSRACQKNFNNPRKTFEVLSKDSKEAFGKSLKIMYESHKVQTDGENNE